MLGACTVAEEEVAEEEVAEKEVAEKEVAEEEVAEEEVAEEERWRRTSTARVATWGSGWAARRPAGGSRTSTRSTSSRCETGS
jgi:hypothetical protein